MNKISTQKSPLSHRKVERSKSPLYVSPRQRTNPHPSNQRDNSSGASALSSRITETSNQGQMGSKGAQQPLQFSTGRKLKYKLPHQYQQGVTSPFVNSSVYTYNSNNVGSQNNKVNNQNKCYDVGFSHKHNHEDIQKLKNNYELQIKAILDGQKNMQSQFQVKIKNIEKQKTYWRQNYLIIKQQFQIYIKNCEQKQKQRQKQKIKEIGEQYGFKPNKIYFNQIVSTPSNKPIIDENLLLIHDQKIQYYTKQIKNLQDQINLLNKQKSSLNFQLTLLKEQNKKINQKVFQLKYELQVVKRQNKECKQKNKQLQQNLAKSSSSRNSDNLCFSLDSKQRNLIPELQTQQSPRSNSGSKSSHQSLNVSSKHRSSKHHRSLSHQGHSSNSKNRYNQNQQTPQFIAMQINLDQQKQIDRLRHATRKFEKSLQNQNSQIMIDGLKKLNSKYCQKIEEENYRSNIYQFINKQNQIKTNFIYQSKINQPNIYKLSADTDSKITMKPITIKYL